MGDRVGGLKIPATLGADAFSLFAGMLDRGELDSHIDVVIRRAMDRAKSVHQEDSRAKAGMFKVGDRGITRGMKAYLNGHVVLIKEIRVTRALVEWVDYDLFRRAAMRVGGRSDLKEVLVPLNCIEPMPDTPVSSR